METGKREGPSGAGRACVEDQQSDVDNGQPYTPPGPGPQARGIFRGRAKTRDARPPPPARNDDVAFLSTTRTA